MNLFAKGQRWISETEPEMGLGTILDFDNRFVEIIFTANDTQRKYAISTAPLRRVNFKVGDKISDKRGKEFLIDTITEKEGLICYHEKHKTLSEIDISDKLSFTTPEDRLFTGYTDKNYLFNLRYESLLLQNEIKGYDYLGLLGARLSLIPHQFYIAKEVTDRPYVRVLLADEVGLGKTIEAGLIIHKLLLNERIERVLIITPEPLLNQWFVEMIRKFNLAFTILDEKTCEEIEVLDPDVNPFEEKQLVLCSLPFLSESDFRQEQLFDTKWDLVVVDEAHNLHWSPDDPSIEYDLIEELALETPHLLLLTATPEQLGIVSHFARLRLLDPERFFDLELFMREVAEYSQVAEVVGNLINKNKITPREQEILLKAYNYDEKIKEQLAEVLKGNEKERTKLIEAMIDQHGTGRILFRNNRSAMHGFPPRVVLPSKLPHQEEFISLKSQHNVSLLKKDPKIDWLVELLKELKDEKVLLICSSKNMVIALDELLKTKINIKTTLFHEDLSLLARDKNAAYFSQKEGANILLCSEIGSEGRNFQFSHNLVLYDLPLNSDLLEQRIGRLDRIGQKNDINIHIPYIENTAQEVLFEIYHKGLNAFQTFPKGGMSVFEKFKEKINLALEKPLEALANKAESLNDLIEKIQDHKQELYLKLERGRDRLLEYNSFRPEVGKHLIEEIQEKDENEDVEVFMNNIFEHFGVEYEELEERIYFVSPSDLMYIDNFPFLPLDGTTLTYDRKSALERDEVTFITNEHPMVSGVIDLLLGSEQGNSAIILFEDAEDSTIILEAVYVLETLAPKELQINRFLPPTPIKTLINQELKVPDYDLYEVMKYGTDLSPDDIFIKPEITKLVKLMLEKTKELAKLEAKDIVEDKLEKMHNILDYEKSRLVELKKVNPNITEKEITFLHEKIGLLDTNIKDYRLRLDSLRLICSDPEEW